MSGSEGVFIQRASFAPYVAHGDNEKGIGSFVEGESIHLKCVHSQAYINAVSAPTPVVWEGPYVRVYPSINTELIRDAEKKWWTGGVLNRNDGTNPANDFVPARAARAPYFEFDAQPGIVLNFPFDCEVSLYTELSGIWAFDMTIFRRPDGFENSRGGPTGIGEIGPRAARLHPQSRYVWGVAAQVTRSLIVPHGCKEYQVLGSNLAGTNPIFSTEDTAQTVANGTSTIRAADVTLDFPITGRAAIGGARSVTITSGDDGSATGITFWCEL